MNKVILMGRLTKDPEVRYSQSAEPVAVARFTIAVNKRFKREGEPDADFIPCVSFGKVGEFTGRYFKKGMMVSVVGRLQVRSWDDQTGQKRWTTEVVVEEQYFAESKASFEANRANSASNVNDVPAPAPMPVAEQSSANIPAQPVSAPSQPEGFYNIEESVDDDDLPF